MDAYLYPHDLSFTFTFYSEWKQTTRITFYWRTLADGSLEDQLPQAKMVMNEVASELYFLSRYGIDKGIIKSGKKKVTEVLYPDYRPYPDTKYFRSAIHFQFPYPYTYKWVKQSEQAIPVWRISEEQMQSGEWVRKAIPHHQAISFKIPCYPRFPKSTHPNADVRSFFRQSGALKRGRRTSGWYALCDYENPTFQSFYNRFFEGGNLCLGNHRIVAHQTNPVSYQLKLTDWPRPKPQKDKHPKRRPAITTHLHDDTDYVYLIRMGRTSLYKIGISNDPQGRLKTLQTASPYKLKLYHTFTADNASAAEQALHAALHNQRKEGEWFELSINQKDQLLLVSEYREGLFWVGDQSEPIERLL